MRWFFKDIGWGVAWAFPTIVVAELLGIQFTWRLVVLLAFADFLNSTINVVRKQKENQDGRT